MCATQAGAWLGHDPAAAVRHETCSFGAGVRSGGSKMLCSLLACVAKSGHAGLVWPLRLAPIDSPPPYPPPWGYLCTSLNHLTTKQPWQRPNMGAKSMPRWLPQRLLQHQPSLLQPQAGIRCQLGPLVPLALRRAHLLAAATASTASAAEPPLTLTGLPLTRRCCPGSAAWPSSRTS